ncbi:MAG: hypothetical protein O7D86_01105 [Proteobacteria bacterium]|nr:hypothetical protein [Pseudomonadota bacterium]
MGRKIRKLGKLMELMGTDLFSPCELPRVPVGQIIGAAFFFVSSFWPRKEKFCTGMYLYCDRMDAKEQWTRHDVQDAQMSRAQERPGEKIT